MRHRFGRPVSRSPVHFLRTSPMLKSFHFFAPKMTSKSDNQRNNEEASVPRNLDQESELSEEEFTECLLGFFRSGLKSSFRHRERDQSELISRSYDRFQHHLEAVRHEEIYVEMLFSIFEIFPFTSWELIRETLERFVFRKVDRYRFIRSVLTRDLPLIESPVEYIHYYVDPLHEDMYSADKLFSPALLLDFSFTKRLLRYGARVQINPLHTRYCLTTIVVCLTEKLLPAVYEYVLWDASRINFAYPTYQDQKRLYWVLLFLYVMVQYKNSELFPKWRSYMESLKLVFKASTEPSITAPEIDRFLRVVTVGEFDERVSEDLYNKCAQEFPRIKEPVTPRSLKDLSRHKVRECLTKSKSLPHGVWYLNAPIHVKHYLLLQETSDEFYPEYVSPLCSRKRSAPDDNFSKRARTSV